MKQDDMEAQAAEYVLGTLDAEARERFRERLTDEPSLRRTVEAWEERLSALSVGETSIEPPTELWDKISSTLDASPPIDFAVTIRASEGQWEVVADGVRKKHLFVDHEEGYESFLLKLAPGACIPAHPHSMTEECLMLEGEVSIGDLRLSAGDYHVISAGTVHPELRTMTGGLLYVRGELRAAAG